MLQKSLRARAILLAFENHVTTYTYSTLQAKNCEVFAVFNGQSENCVKYTVNKWKLVSKLVV